MGLVVPRRIALLHTNSSGKNESLEKKPKFFWRIYEGSEIKEIGRYAKAAVTLVRDQRPANEMSDMEFMIDQGSLRDFLSKGEQADRAESANSDG